MSIQQLLTSTFRISNWQMSVWIRNMSAIGMWNQDPNAPMEQMRRTALPFGLMIIRSTRSPETHLEGEKISLYYFILILQLISYFKQIHFPRSRLSLLCCVRQEISLLRRQAHLVWNESTSLRPHSVSVWRLCGRPEDHSAWHQGQKCGRRIRTAQGEWGGKVQNVQNRFLTVQEEALLPGLKL